MSKVALSGNALGSGTFTIASPNSNTDRTLSLPDATGTILTTATAGVPVNGPAFSATDTATTATASVTTKVVFDTTVFNLGSAFDGTKFQPAVAGYYQVNASVKAGNATNASVLAVYVYKNGASQIANQFWVGAGWSGTTALASELIYMNGSTDYLEVYGNNATNANLGAATFSAFLARSAT